MKSEGKRSQPNPSDLNQCRVFSPADGSAWTSKLQDLDAETRFLCERWLPLLERSYGYETGLVTLEDSSSRLLAALPFAEVRSGLTGNRGIAVPFFDLCRCFLRTADVDPLPLYAEFIAEGKRRGWDYIELRGGLEALPVKPSLTFYNHVVPLAGDEKSLFDALSSANRRAIRKAEKSGVSIEVSQDLEAVKGFYRLQCITRKRHGLPPQPFSFFKTLHQELIENGDGLVISAKLEGTLVASAVYLVQGDTVHYKYGASDKRFQEARCNNLVMWEAIKRYSAKGLQRLDLGRNSLANQGLRKYKQSWGSIETTESYHRYDLKKDIGVPMRDEVYGWHNHFFRILPTPLSMLAGKLLYRHIA